MKRRNKKEERRIAVGDIITAIHPHMLDQECSAMTHKERIGTFIKGIIYKDEMVLHITDPQNENNKKLLIDMLKSGIQHLEIEDTDGQVH